MPQTKLKFSVFPLGNIAKEIEELKELSYKTITTRSTTKTLLYETHSQAKYKSRLLNLSYLPDPVNCSNQEEFISSIITEANDYTSESDTTECYDCIITNLSKSDVDDENKK
ncbi:hypothetical protein C1645_835662 [Glomus cerebriforme]|uniref:Uncharacterized protein n=1 Tax=Glomus cerebriforme TaxID=658196 RepID=A0A397SBL3_9GLOM|nr:hypothetical protein C1645_835662 [Glomus cerebriforme]